MSGHYLPLATIAWGLSLYYLVGDLDALGKCDGLLGLKSLSIVRNLDIGQRQDMFFILTWAVLHCRRRCFVEPAGLTDPVRAHFVL